MSKVRPSVSVNSWPVTTPRKEGKQQMWQSIAAIIFAFWPLPIGVGYLFLKRWRRFLFAFLGLQIIAMTAFLMIFGSGLAFNLFTAAVFLSVMGDTWYLAIGRLRQL